MPELPEVETVARTLAPLIRGRVLGRAALTCAKILRQAPPDGPNPPRRRASPANRVPPGETAPSLGLAALEGRRVREVRRRGKMVVIDCGDLALVFHLKMTGQLLVVPGGAPRDKHTHLAIELQGGDGPAELRFRDVRKFGFGRIVPAADLGAVPELAALGPEPLEIGREDFRALLARRRGRIKSLLLNQAVIAGIGNIYADEILFAARVHPLTPAERLRRPEIDALWTQMGAILRRAIAAKGTSISDYTDAEGRTGGFQDLLRIYGREGEPCVRCGTAVRRIVIGGRSACFCPRCQRLRRAK